MQKTFYIKTFGCQMNERDSEIMAQLLSEAHYIETSSVDDADLVILNTCSIRAKAEQKVMSMLGQLRHNIVNKPDMEICVAGCVAQQEGINIIRKMPHVTLVIGTQNIYDIANALSIAKKGKNKVVTSLDDTYRIPHFLPQPDGKEHSSEPYRKFITIMQGCNNFCSYCVVPYTRGREVSRNAQDILDEAKILIKNGVKEITLLGQNVNSYGQTNSVIEGEKKGEYGFSKLLYAVAELKKYGLQRLRFTTSNPKDLTDDLIACFSSIDILCPQLHLPLQAGSNAVLKRMNRKYTAESYLKIVEKLKNVCPNIVLTTDIIVGFPGETEKDFEETMKMLEVVRYHGSFSFKYSPRPETRAASFDNMIDERTKSERLMRFQTRQDQISLERNEEYINTVQTIMLEESDSPTLLYRGRTESNHIVHLKKGVQGVAGDLIDVLITHAGQHSLKGEFI